jgi:23S rRNA G2445 N2-methylase RlmL
VAPTAYYALVVPGIEDLAAAELTRKGARVTETLSGFDKRDSIIVFTASDIAEVMRGGLLDEVFQIASDQPTPASPKGAKLLAAALDRVQLERAMVTHHALRPKTGKRTFKVVTRVAGKQAFKRDELETAYISAVSAMLSRWAPSGDKAAIEVWVQVIGARTLTGVRLSGDELAQRRYKRAHLPASLTPTVARALVELSEPQPGEVMLDPMCGAGTILRERAEAGGERANTDDGHRAVPALILGGDVDSAALEAARVNASKQSALALWDARRLPLPAGSVDAVVTNPPYGRQHGATAGLDKLYAGALREIARVLRPGGRAVVLTGEPAVLGRAVPMAMRIVSRRRMLLRGLAVVAFVLERG